MKTHRGAAKRFRALGSGKFKRAKKGRRHLLSNKSTKRKRGLRDRALVHESDHNAVRRMLPYA